MKQNQKKVNNGEKWEFLYLRTSFRTMMEYYKQMHTSYIDEVKASEGGSKVFNKNLGNTSKEQMDEVMKPFIEEQLALKESQLLKGNSDLSDIDT